MQRHHANNESALTRRTVRDSAKLVTVLLLFYALVAHAKAPREMGLLPEPHGDLMGFENATSVPALPSDGELVIEKVRPVDCRVVLGFVHSPVDGRPDSWGYNGVVNEYDDSQGYADGHWQNICYEHIKDPGVHVTLADDRGFNLLYLRGGFMGRIFRDVDTDNGPGAGQLIATLGEKDSCGVERPEHYRIHRLTLDKPIGAKKVSFFGRERLLADAQFLRVGAAATKKEYTGSQDFVIGETVADVTTLGPDFVKLPADSKEEQHPSNFERRFPRAGDRTVYVTAERGQKREGQKRGQSPSEKGTVPVSVLPVSVPVSVLPFSVPLAASQQAHFLTPPLPANLPVGAVRLDLELTGVPAGNLINLTVQDPLIGNQELLRVDVKMTGSPRIQVLLDFPDQLIAEGRRFWITLASQHAGTLTANSKFSLLTVPPETAKAEHWAWRLFLLKGCFYVLSEIRPWTGRQFSVKWLEQYGGGEWEIQRVRPQLLDLFRTVEHLRALDPQHPVAANQYYDWLTRQGGVVDTNAVPTLDLIPGVPRWAQLLDRAAREVVTIPLWWLTHRMASNGEFGGTLNDDTDLTPWWIPSAFLDSEGFAPTVREAHQRLAKLVLTHNLRDGVNLRTTDALHAYEEGQNLMCHMPLLFYGDPRCVEWLMQSARTANGWLVRTADGKLKFRTNDFGHDTAVNPPANPAEKISGNAGLMLHSHLMLAWYNRNPAAVKVLADIADPAAGNALNGFGGPGIPLAAYWFTGDSKYLGLTDTGKDSRGNWWARFLPEYVVHGREARALSWWKSYVENAKWQTEFGDWAWAAEQNREALCRSLQFALYGNPHSGAGGAARYRYMWTEAEKFTDRVFLPVQPIAQPMLGGYTVRNRIFPAYAVSYENLGGDFAALVIEQGRDKLTLAMINLRDKPREGAFRVWQLDHGRYELKIGPDANDDGALDSVEKTETLELARMSRVPVTLPPRALVIYKLTQVEKLDDLYARPDLAISPADVAVSDKTVQVIVHNIGSSPAKDFVVALTDDKGKVLASQSNSRLDAPLDLMPRTVTVELPLKSRASHVVLDPQNRVPEITEENNELPLHQE